MKKKMVFLSAAIVCFLFVASGCAPLIVGAALGGAGGYAISKDTIQGHTDTPYDRVWQAAVSVARSRGLLQKEDARRGELEIKIESSHVWIKLIKLTRSTTRLRVSARKFGLPKLSLAEDIFVKIMDGLR